MKGQKVMHILVCICVVSSYLEAQINPGISTYFLSDTSTKYKVGTQQILYLNSNTLKNQFLFAGLSGNPLEVNTVKGFFKPSPRQNFLLGYDLYNSLAYTQRISAKSQFFIGIKNKVHGHAALDNDLAQLIFVGNKHRQQDTMRAMTSSNITQFNYQQLQFGYQYCWASQDIYIGGSLSYLNGSNWFELEIPQFSLYTEQYGQFVDAHLQAQQTQSDPQKNHFFSTNAQGFSVDVYANLPTPIFLKLDSSMARFKLEVNDLGALYWNSKTQVMYMDTTLNHYQGFDINEYLKDTTYQESFRFLNTRSLKSKKKNLPFYLNVSLEKKISKLTYTIGLTNRADAYYTPYIYVQGAFNVNPWFNLITGLNYGAYGNLGGSAGFLFKKDTFFVQLIFSQIDGLLFMKKSMGNGLNLQLFKQF